jgi:hypothetical protein
MVRPPSRRPALFLHCSSWRQGVTLHRLDIIAAALLALVGVAIAFQGLSFGFMSDGVPGAGFFPLLAGVLVAGVSVVNLVRALRRLEILKGEVSFRQLRPVLGICAVLAIFAALVPYLGFLLPLPFVLVALSYLIDPRPGLFWFVQIGGLSAIFTVFCYYLFELWLGVLFPLGPLGF